MKPYLFALGAFFCWGSLPRRHRLGAARAARSGLVHGVAISPFVWGGMALILASSYLCRRFG